MEVAGWRKANAYFIFFFTVFAPFSVSLRGLHPKQLRISLLQECAAKRSVGGLFNVVSWR